MDYLNNLDNTDIDDEEFASKLVRPYGEKKVPLSIEFVMTVTKILMIVIVVVVGILSFLAHVPWLEILLRIGVAILVTGFAGYVGNWIFGKYYIDATLNELQEIETAYAEKMKEENEEFEDEIE